VRVSRLLTFPLLATLVAFGAVACGNDATANGGSGVQPAAASGNAGHQLIVSQKDFAITLNQATAASGALTLVIHNAGPSPHELKVFRTNLAEDQLPTNSAGDVNETGSGVTRVAATPATTAPGSSQQLLANLSPGRYVLICNLPAHYRIGMHTVLVVS
jgi:uncharacterized cupredoxin-like copper-binding protein